jgi:23S rRNA (adenine2030-N6)-methyltransferase
MKYRHRFHAGNFADVHKHVTLLALLEALKRKDKGFLYLETHAGRGSYDLRDATAARASLAGIERVLAAAGPQAPTVTDAPVADEELRIYAGAITAWRERTASATAYPGSPLLAALHLRPQDRAVLIEVAREEASALERELPAGLRAQVRCADGFETLTAFLPPPERRGLVLIDPPYEQGAEDLARAQQAVAEILRRFANAVIALWYPIKDRSDDLAWQAQLAQRLAGTALLAELWWHPCDSRVALNGSGLVIVNPPYQLGARMQNWLPHLAGLLDLETRGGTLLRAL